MTVPRQLDTRPNRAIRRQALRAARICVYCGKIGGDTDDHVPPENLFETPLPNDLITVPACNSCNGSFSKDDEYFRLKIGLDETVSNHSAVRSNLDTIFRSLQRSQAGGLRRMMAADTRMVQLQSPAGLFLGRRLAFEVDLRRIFRVVARVVRGLFFHETKRRLLDAYDVGVTCDDTLTKEPPDVLAQWKENIITPLATICEKVVGNGVFGYRHAITVDNPDVSAWALTFYGRKSFIALTGPVKPEG